MVIILTKFFRRGGFEYNLLLQRYIIINLLLIIVIINKPFVIAGWLLLSILDKTAVNSSNVFVIRFDYKKYSNYYIVMRSNMEI